SRRPAFGWPARRHQRLHATCRWHARPRARSRRRYRHSHRARCRPSRGKGQRAMKVWDICIQRPIFTMMLVSAPIVLGLAAYSRLGVDLFPNVDLPVVTITTTLRGTSVEEMETQVTKPIEEIVNTIAGIDELRSTTTEGISQVTIQFLLEK